MMLAYKLTMKIRNILFHFFSIQENMKFLFFQFILLIPTYTDDAYGDKNFVKTLIKGVSGRDRFKMR